MKQIFSVLFFVILISAPALSAAETVVLRLKWYHQFQFAGYYAALSKGFYRQAGLHVDIREGDSENDSVEEVAAGRANYGVSNSEVLLRYLRGKPIVVLAVIFQHSPLVFITPENSGIRHPQDMIGRRVGVNQSTRDAELLAMLQNEGVSFRSILPPDGGKCTLTMHYDGTADAASAYITNEPFDLEQKHIPYRIIHPLNYGIDFYGDCLFTSKSEWEKRPERVSAFREASLRGWEYAMEHPEEIADYIIANYGNRKSRAHLLYEAQKMKELILPRLIEIGHMNPGRWRHIADTFVKLKMINPEYSLKGFLYEPNFRSDIRPFRRFIHILLFSLLTAACGISVLIYFNRRLRTEVRERKEAEKKLKFQAELMDQIQDFIVATDMKGRIIYCNNAVTRFFGKKSKNEMVGKSVDILSPPRELHVQQKIIQETLSRGSWQGEVVNYAKDGFPHILETRTWVITEPVEGVSGMVGVSSDITERKKMAEDLRAAMEAAEAASRAKSEFLANMSHEIRTPMNAILGFTEILIQRSRDKQEQYYLEAIRSGGRVLLSLINDILDLSKIEAGKMEIRREATDIRNLFKEIQIFFSEKFREKQLEFRLHIPEDLPRRILLDEVRLRQILINLVGNALKFTSRGYVRVSAAQQKNPPCPENHLNLLLEVEDTGIGIADDQTEIIFDSFEQQKNQNIRQYGGTGLGLSISRRLAEMMQGHLTVESKSGKGSTFRLLLRGLVPAESDTDGAAENIPDRRNGNPAVFENAEILLVDDLPLNRELIKNYLKNSGLSVREAENGKQALHLLKSGHIPHLILMDLRMPEMDGYETTKIIRDDEKFCNIPVIACTAAAMKQDEKHPKALFDAFLTKPLGKKELLESLQHFLPCRGKTPAKEKKELSPGETGLFSESPIRLPELIRILEKDFMPRWKSLGEYFFLEDISSFAEKLRKTAQQYQHSVLGNYAQELYESVEKIDIDKMDRLIRRFPELLEKQKAKL